MSTITEQGRTPPAVARDSSELARRTSVFIHDHVLPVERDPIVSGRHMDDNGPKPVITGADGAALFLSIVRTDGWTTMFLVDQDTPGVAGGRRMPMLDHSAPGGHREVIVTDCLVPNAGPQYAQARLALARLAFCMSVLGLAVRAYAMAVGWIQQRSCFGRPICEHGMAQADVADNEIDIIVAPALVCLTAAVFDAEGATSAAARLGDAVVAEAVSRVLDRVVRSYGGRGICEDRLVARLLVEARGLRICEGSSEVLPCFTARRVLREHPSASAHYHEEA